MPSYILSSKAVSQAPWSAEGIPKCQGYIKPKPHPRGLCSFLNLEDSESHQENSPFGHDWDHLISHQYDARTEVGLGKECP